MHEMLLFLAISCCLSVKPEAEPKQVGTAPEAIAAPAAPIDTTAAGPTPGSDVPTLPSTQGADPVENTQVVEDEFTRYLREQDVLRAPQRGEEKEGIRDEIRDECWSALSRCKSDCGWARVEDDDGNEVRDFEDDCEDACKDGFNDCEREETVRDACDEFVSTCKRRCPSFDECDDACRSGGRVCG